MSLSRRRLLEQIVSIAETRLALVEVPGVGGVAAAEVALGANGAFRAARGAVAAESLEAFEPDSHEVVLFDVSLDELGALLDIQTGANVAVAADARREDPRGAEKIVVADHAFVGNAEIVRAAEGDLHRAFRIVALLADKGDQIGKVFGSEQHIALLARTSDGLHVDDPPALDLHLFELGVEGVEIGDIRAVHDGRHLWTQSRILERLHAADGAVPSPSVPTKVVVRLFHPVHTDGHRGESRRAEALRRLVVDQGAVRRHAPVKAEGCHPLRDLEEVGMQERFAARQADHGSLPADALQGALDVLDT